MSYYLALFCFVDCVPGGARRRVLDPSQEVLLGNIRECKSVVLGKNRLILALRKRTSNKPQSEYVFPDRLLGWNDLRSESLGRRNYGDRLA